MAAPDGLFEVESPDPYVARCVVVLRSAPGWVGSPGRDEMLIADLMREYPELQLLTELTRWVAWMNAKSKTVDSRGGVLRVRNWFGRGRVFRVASRGAAQVRGRDAARAARSGASPSSKDELASEAHEGIRGW
jgi:hypothetical protein